MDAMKPILICAAIFTLTFSGAATSGSSPCSMEPKNAMLEYAYHCVQGLLDGFRTGRRGSFPSNFYHLSAWNDTCRGQANLPNCISNVVALRSCGDDVRTKIFQEAKSFVDSEWLSAGFHPTPGTCNYHVYNFNISQLYLAPSEICRQLVTDNIDIKIEDWLNNLSENEAYISSDGARETALKLYQEAVGKSPTKCGKAGRNLAKFIVDQAVPTKIRNNITLAQIVQVEEREVNNKPFLLSTRATVGVFGDPHIKSFGGYQLQTCEVTGSRDYLVNRYFRFSAIADHVQSGSKGTALTEISIAFYDRLGDVSTLYKASDEDLPAIFTNEQASGLMIGNMEITVHQTGDRSVGIRVVDLGLVIHIRRWGGFYSVTVRGALELFRQSSGLLVDGCDYKNTIDVYMYTQRNKRDTDECKEACSNLNDTRRFSYSTVCEFDCLAYGNKEISAMTTDFQSGLQVIEDEDSTLPLIPVIIVQASNQVPSCVASFIFVLASTIVSFFWF